MSEVVDKAVKLGLKLGASEVEARYSIGKTISVKIEANEISDASWCVNRALSLAVILGKKLGFSRTTDISPTGIERAVKEAYALAKSSKENPNWKSIPSPNLYPQVVGTFDDRIASLDSQDAMRMAVDMMREARADPRVSIMGGVVNATQGNDYVANSNGIFGDDKGTSLSAYVVAVAREAGEVGSFADSFESSRKLDFDVRDVARDAAEKALESLHLRSVDSFTGTIVLDHDAVQDFALALAYALNGDKVWRGSSPLRDKVGQNIAVDKFTFLDDGTLDGGISTSKFDYEGVPRRRTTLIDGGVLRGFIHNTYTAGIMNSESTGNAIGFLSVGPSNLVIPPGTKDSEEILEEIRRGLLIRRFSGHVRSEDGLVSGSVKQTILIEDGERKYPIKECMISGNLYQFLKNITSMSKSVRRRGNLLTPQIVIEGVSIIGKA